MFAQAGSEDLLVNLVDQVYISLRHGVEQVQLEFPFDS